MKTEFLEVLVLEQEQIDKIMAPNGKDIARGESQNNKCRRGEK